VSPMSKITLTAALVLIAFPSVGFAQNCALSGTPAWSKQVRNLIQGCDNWFSSPDGGLILRVDAEGRILFSETVAKSEVQIRSHEVEPPAMASWSPKSDAFFINDGEGSGMTSVFRLFRVKSGLPIEDATIETKGVALYRSLKQCSAPAEDPNVWGIGWSSNGTLLYLLIQASVHAPCGESGSFIVATVKVTDGSVVERFSEEAAKRQFRILLPRELYSK